MGNKINDFGMDFKFYHGNRSVGSHRHQDIELVYLMEGNAEVKLEDTAYRLKQDDVIIINSNQPHVWADSETVMLGIMQISYQTLSQTVVSDSISFWCNSVADKENDYTELRSIIKNLITEYAIDMEHLTFKKMSLFYALLNCIVNRYMLENTTRMSAIYDDDIMKTVLDYINSNYWKPINLREVASIAFMTDSAFSKYFKKHTGINFVKYLNNLRLHHAVEDLLQTNKPLTGVAMDNGFTNPSMFSKAFRASYGVAPSDYKKLKRDSAKADLQGIHYEPDEQTDLKRYVARLKDVPAGEMFEKKISVDVRNYRKLDKVWNKCLNVGSAHELLSGKLQGQLLVLKKELGFSYLRIFNIFSWDMKLRKDRQLNELNFAEMDTVLDFIVYNGMHPFIEFGDKPRRALRSTQEMVFQDDDQQVFASVEEAEFIMRSFVEHIALRYGIEEVENWYFESWFDNRTERKNVNYDYLDFFDLTSKIIKSRVPKARVGGAGFELGSGMEDMIWRWINQEYQPDFISFSAFPYKRSIPGFNVNNAIRSTDVHFVKNELSYAKRTLKECGLGSIDIFLTEFNLSISDRNYYNDSCGKAPLLLANMIELLDDIKMGAYWYGSDLNTMYYDTRQILFGGAGLVSKDGLPKPSYFSISFMNLLGKYIIQSGDGYIVTTNGDNNYHIILFNYKYPSYNYYLKNEDQIAIEDVDLIFENDEPMEFKLILDFVQNSHYYIKSFDAGPQSCDILKEWKALGESEMLNLSDIQYLRRICVPRVNIKRQQADNGQIVLDEVLQAYSIRYIHVYQ